jgi:signal transduction histidine kinase
LPIRAAPLFLDDLIHDCARAARGLAVSRGVALEAAPADEAPFIGDADLLRRLVMILLDNAIKYTPSGGQVRLTLRREDGGKGGSYVIAVEDTGPGVPASARERIFERFFRVDLARTRMRTPTGAPAPVTDPEAAPRREDRRGHGDDLPVPGDAHHQDAGGTGLGLAIARWIAEAHGGSTRLASTGPTGSRFEITLPVSDVRETPAPVVRSP